MFSNDVSKESSNNGLCQEDDQVSTLYDVLLILV